MILVSACLAGYPCRYDGQSQANGKIVELVRQGKALPVCPEQLGGLTTPRLPAEIQTTGDGSLKVMNIVGEDVTSNFVQGALTTLEIARFYDAEKAILKQNSPSCGVGHRYDGTFSGTIIEGDGITAKLLRDNDITVEPEDKT